MKVYTPKAQSRGIAEMVPARRLNSCREPGNALVYALGNPMPGDRLYAAGSGMPEAGNF